MLDRLREGRLQDGLLQLFDVLDALQGVLRVDLRCGQAAADRRQIQLVRCGFLGAGGVRREVRHQPPSNRSTCDSLAGSRAGRRRRSGCVLLQMDPTELLTDVLASGERHHREHLEWWQPCLGR